MSGGGERVYTSPFLLFLPVARLSPPDSAVHIFVGHRVPLFKSFCSLCQPMFTDTPSSSIYSLQDIFILPCTGYESTTGHSHPEGDPSSGSFIHSHQYFY